MLAFATAVGIAIAGLGVPAAASAEVGTSPRILINEVYGGGGNSGAPFNRDFIELYNASDQAVDVTGWSVQYASAAGSTWQVTPLTGTIDAGEFLLVGESSAATGAPIVVDVEGSIPMGGTAGKVALSSSAAALTCSPACAGSAEVVDLVGYGAAANEYAGTGPAVGASNTTSVSRSAAHANTANNAADFTAQAPVPANQPETPDIGDASIAEIQGPGSSSPDANSRATTRGVVTATYPTGGFNGFVIQELGTGGDGDPATRTSSDALYVFSPRRRWMSRSATTSRCRGSSRSSTASPSEHVDDLRRRHGAARRRDGAAPRRTLDLADFGGGARDARVDARPTRGGVHRDEHVLDEPVRRGRSRGGTTPLLQPTDVARPGTAEAAAVAADNIARRVSVDDGASLNFPSMRRIRRSCRRSSRSMSRSASAPR